MKLTQLSYFAALAGSHVAADNNKRAHGDGYEGTIMGPAAFLWPEGRTWSASTDNSGPCGSPSGVVNRTQFPLTQGTVELSIADDAWHVNFSIAYDNTPSIQSQFSQQVVKDVAEIEPGHQCYKIASIPDNVVAGTNATIQLTYWSHYENENNGNNETFYSCADITFVKQEDLTAQPPCFNVTASDFDSGSSSSSAPSTPSATGASPSSTAVTNDQASSSPGDGLSGGAKAGIAVGVIVASLAIVGVIAFVVLRRRKSQPLDREASAPAKGQPEVASVNSHRN
ncbi:uncharacterized protein F4822DRAFT_73213 [Hypoxylon trugodes]|uniref:uncharacterized protein n=1 Tax=Hypoxylon trugodes TaxID=326681 RepID=UPI002196889E|nr:uncharacterized protein F4822DRAFT_73213 [Hypoxylon trugodes]KAI1383313.1 hypothetical protein F4822DRAFT_73213 [Hypoxylon trugodes]